MVEILVLITDVIVVILILIIVSTFCSVCLGLKWPLSGSTFNAGGALTILKFAGKFVDDL